MVEDICTVSSRINYLGQFADEVVERETKRKELLHSHVHHRTEGAIALALLTLNCVLFVTFTHYVVGWVVCSLFLISFYPLITLIPKMVKAAIIRPVNASAHYVNTLKSLKILKKSEQFYHIEWSVFFINLRSVAVALGILCTSNIFAVTGLFLIVRQELEIGSFVTIQFLLFFILYLLAVILKPYNRRFEAWAGRVVARVHEQKPVIWFLVPALGLFGFFMALSLLAAYLSPPTTALQLLEYESIEVFLFPFEFMLIILSQFILVRYIHSVLSRRTSWRVSTAIETFVQENILPVMDNARAGILDEQEIDCAHYREMMTDLLEAKMYRTAVSTVFGLFPVFLFRPDLSLILEPDVLKTLRGHMSIAD